MEELGVKALRRNLRKEYKTYLDVFKENITFEDVLNDDCSARALALVKELHYFCMNDVENYELIEKVYDLAFVECFNSVFSKQCTFYSYLLIMFRELEDYNLLEWGGIIQLFENIVENSKRNDNYKTTQDLINEVVEKYDLDYFKVLEDVDKALDEEFGYKNRKVLSEEWLSKELYETILLSYKEECEK